MGLFLGLDTSNYTTSAAIYDSSNDTVTHSRKLLPVREGEMGLRQSDAVFAHVKQLPDVVSGLLGDRLYRFSGVGCSVRPRDVEGSYMPCFLVGEMLARVLAGQSAVPLSEWSHQAGHVAAALYSARRLDLLHKKFIAFHFSGGTTEGLLVRPSREHVFEIVQLCGTLDLNAGQVIDRVGVMLGLPFPSGKELEKLALTCEAPLRAQAKLKGMDCCLSGVENQCRALYEKGVPKNTVARFCMDSVVAAVQGMTQAVLLEYGDLPCVYAGGVTSNSLLRGTISEWLGGVFATPELSSDNAVGIAVLAHLQSGESVFR